MIASGVDAAEMERRAQHMREQREALIAKKKAARNEKVLSYTSMDDSRVVLDSNQNMVSHLVNAIIY